MSTDFNELFMIYTKANLELCDIYEVAIPSGVKSLGGTTSENVCGFVIPVKGKARFTIDNHSYELKPGVILHAGSGIKLDKEVLGDSEWKYILLHYRILGDSEYRKVLEKQNYMLTIGHNGSMEIEILLQKLLRLVDNKNLLHGFKSKVLLYSIIENILQFSWQLTIDKKEESLYHMIEFIHCNVDKSLSVLQIAEKFNMEAKQFNYLFQKRVGICPKKYLIQCKMNRAKELLKDVNYSISDVASMVGYEDPLHFSRIFKKNNGFAPSVYRENLEKNPWRF